MRRSLLPFAAIAAAGSIVAAGVTAFTLRPTAAVNSPTPSASFTYSPNGLVAHLTGTTTMPACAVEDGGPELPCRWNAAAHGTGKGRSFAAVATAHNGRVFVYDDGTVRTDDPTATVFLVTPMPHGCSDGSDIVALVGGVTYTRNMVMGKLARCDEQ
jgi:hypothetical protein